MFENPSGPKRFNKLCFDRSGYNQVRGSTFDFASAPVWTSVDMQGMVVSPHWGRKGWEKGELRPRSRKFENARGEIATGIRTLEANARKRKDGDK
jgi:hypothetical protein